jgi:phosphoglycolate phosphatase-like HAD superfamily hydrolase
MAKKEPGYVYILTNPSFREDWVKIGKSSRPVDVRSRELDNTAVPLPFEIFATMKTTKYNEAEKHVHHSIERFTNRRIRNNREFFNVKPEEAVMVGDRPLTDILGGIRLGCKTILVGSINPNENWPTKLVRALERSTIKK